MKRKETMTSRERVLKTINHEPVDRMPIDLGMHYSTGISAFAYQNLRKHLGMDYSNIEMIDMIQCLARVDEDILERFHIDTILLNPGWEKTKVWNPRQDYKFIIPHNVNPHKQEDGSYIMNFAGEDLLMPEGGFFFDGGWPNFAEGSEDEQIANYAKEAKRLFYETDYFMVYSEFGAFFEGIMWCCDALISPDSIKLKQEVLLKEALIKVKKIINEMGSYIQAIGINSDLGMQNAPMCSVDFYNEMVAPYLKTFLDYIHENSDLKVFMHSCGSIEPLIPSLIDCGVDIINPVQISAQNMEPDVLKEKYGDQITFWGGGCDTQNILGAKTPEEVRANVRNLVKSFKQNGGFVFNQVHNIMGNVPPENIVTMLEEAYEQSWYNIN